MLNVLNIRLSESRRNKTEKNIFEFQKRSFQNEVTVLVLNRRLCFIFYAAFSSFSSTRGSVCCCFFYFCYPENHENMTGVVIMANDSFLDHPVVVFYFFLVVNHGIHMI